jgi:periplasmic divalent cation tolerance protein
MLPRNVAPASEADGERERARVVVITTTTEDRADAERIAGRLIDERLAACVQISRVESRYRWKGELATTDEWLCTVKTRASLVAAVERAIRAIHPYEVPEFLVTEATGGGADYLAWIASETESIPSTPTSSEP